MSEVAIHDLESIRRGSPDIVPRSRASSSARAAAQDEGAPDGAAVVQLSTQGERTGVRLGFGEGVLRSGDCRGHLRRGHLERAQCCGISVRSARDRLRRARPSVTIGERHDCIGAEREVLACVEYDGKRHLHGVRHARGYVDHVMPTSVALGVRPASISAGASGAWCSRSGALSRGRRRPWDGGAPTLVLVLDLPSTCCSDLEARPDTGARECPGSAGRQWNGAAPSATAHVAVTPAPPSRTATRRCRRSRGRGERCRSSPGTA